MLHLDRKPLNNSARVLTCGLLCALALVSAHSAQPESAHAAKVTHGWATGTIYFNKSETQTIGEWGPAASFACQRLLPGWASLACAYPTALTIQANRARYRNMCLKVKVLLANPSYNWPDIYRGGYCH